MNRRRFLRFLGVATPVAVLAGPELVGAAVELVQPSTIPAGALFTNNISGEVALVTAVDGNNLTVVRDVVGGRAFNPRTREWMEFDGQI